MLQFHRESVRAPHLVVVESTGRNANSRDSGVGDLDGRKGRALWRSPVVLVLVATLLAVVVDLVDSVPAWSPWAALGSLLVLVTHASASLLRSR